MNEPVLLIPMVLALLGDNPMQSEFACHIGLKGKLFCRACWVKGTDAQADATQHQSDSPKASSHGSEADTASDSEASERNSDGAATASVAPSKRKKGRQKRALESMSSMVDRVKAFTKVKFYND